ncbi:hypothetical protein J26TS2_32210 [Shouchella clausii]|nr:hypothetical protein J26TS2_32210 [Shouchella clausii]
MTEKSSMVILNVSALKMSITSSYNRLGGIADDEHAFNDFVDAGTGRALFSGQNSGIADA